MKKINSINFGGKMILAGIILGVLLPVIAWMITGKLNLMYAIPGGVILVVFFVIFAIEMKQDNGKVPYFEKSLKEKIPFNPELQTPVIKSSICTGEKVAGFKDKKTGHFVEVMVIRSDEEKKRFMNIYGIEQITTEY